MQQLSVEAKPVRDPVRTRARILAAARAEFEQHGLGASVNDIAARAGSNKRLIYHYFDSKEGLYIAVLEITYSEFSEALRELRIEDLSPSEAIETFAMAVFDYLAENPGIVRLANIENMYRAEHLRQSQLMRGMFADMAATIEDALARRAAAGTHPAEDPVQFLITLISLGYYFLANRHTLSVICGRDHTTEDALAARRSHVASFVARFV